MEVMGRHFDLVLLGLPTDSRFQDVQKDQTYAILYYLL